MKCSFFKAYRWSRDFVRQGDRPKDLTSSQPVPSSGLATWAAALMLLLGFATDSSARLWYVGKSGKDTNPGTSPDAAVLTLSQARNLASANDQILLGPGIYPESLSSIKPLTYGAWGGIATITGGIPMLVADAGADWNATVSDRIEVMGTAYFYDAPEDPGYTSTWTLISGDRTKITIEQPNGLNTYVHFTGAGDFVLRLTLQGLGVTSFDDVLIHTVGSTSDPTVGGSNETCVLSASADQPDLLGTCDCNRSPSFQASTTLRGTEANCSGAPRQYLWKQLSGEATAILATPNQLNTTVSFTAPGCYRFQLTSTSPTDPTHPATSEIQVSVASPKASSWLSLKFVDRSFVLSNASRCSTLSYAVVITSIDAVNGITTAVTKTYTGTIAGGQSLTIATYPLQTGSGVVSAPMTPSGKISQANYVSGCGAGTSTGCPSPPSMTALASVGTGTTTAPSSSPELLLFQRSDRPPVVVLNPVNGWINVVEGSSNLIEWSTLLSVPGSSQPIVVEDPAAGQHTHRFYRARVH